MVAYWVQVVAAHAEEVERISLVEARYRWGEPGWTLDANGRSRDCLSRAQEER